MHDIQPLRGGGIGPAHAHPVARLSAHRCRHTAPGQKAPGRSSGLAGSARTPAVDSRPGRAHNRGGAGHLTEARTMIRVVIRGVVRAVALLLTVAAGLSAVLLVGGMESIAANSWWVALAWMAGVAVLAVLAGLFWLADARFTGRQLQRGTMLGEMADASRRLWKLLRGRGGKDQRG